MMRTIRTLAEPKGFIEECNQAEGGPHDAMNVVFEAFRMYAPTGIPPDPVGDAYRRRQVDGSTVIAGRSYNTANEVTTFDMASAVHCPFPSYLCSTRTAAPVSVAPLHSLRDAAPRLGDV